METQSNAFLGTEKVSRLMRKFALPCVISLLVGALYNIVDQIYIANASYLGSYGNAAAAPSSASAWAPKTNRTRTRAWAQPSWR